MENKTIWLNFLGGRVVEPRGTDFNGDKDYLCSPYDIDGDPDRISLQEAQAIELIWEQVSEDYAPYNVNVTTVVPTVRNPSVFRGHDNK